MIWLIAMIMGALTLPFAFQKFWFKRWFRFLWWTGLVLLLGFWALSYQLSMRGSGEWEKDTARPGAYEIVWPEPVGVIGPAVGGP